MSANHGAIIGLLDGTIQIDPLELLKHGHSTGQSVVVLSGTLLEGFGNLHSDLDLYVIGEELPKQSPEVPGGPATTVVRQDGSVRRFNQTLTRAAGILLDVQYYTFRELDTLARSLNVLYVESRQSTKRFRKTLHPEDEDLIHKLLTGRVLEARGTAFDARKIFDPGTFCFLKYRNEVGGYSEFRDLVGSWTAGDLDTCLYNTRSYLISQVSAMMFLAGSTNPRPKWFIRKLASMGAAYAKLHEDVMSWMYSPRCTDVQKRRGVESACDLIDTTYSFQRSLLDSNDKYFSAREAIALTDREFAGRGGEDPDATAKWKLRQRMFNAGAPPLISFLENQGRGNSTEDSRRAHLR